MNHVFPATTTLRRAAGYAGALACTLVLCTACVGSSSGNGTAGASGTSTSTPTGGTTGTGGNGGIGGTGGSGGSGGTSTGGTGSGSGTTSTATSGGGSGGTGGSGGSGNGGSSPATCLTRYLGGSVGSSQGAAGSVYFDIIFKNLDNKPCTLDGYPGVSLGGGNPVQQVGQPASRNPQVSPAKVTLQPGGHAFAVLQIADAGNYPSSTCRPEATTYLQVYPPNDSNLLYIAYNTTGCRGNVVTMQIEAVQPGTGS